MFKKLLLVLVMLCAVGAMADTASARRWGYYGPRPVYGPRVAYAPRAAYYGYYPRPVPPRVVYRSYYRPAPYAYGYGYGVYPRPFVPYTSTYYYPGFGAGYYYY